MTAAITTAGDALLWDVLLTPADDAPRLILADWLDEHGSEARAEFIRVQCELAREPCLRADPSYPGAGCYTPGCRHCDRAAPPARRERELLSHLCLVLAAETPFGTRCVLSVDGRDESSLPVLTCRRGWVDEAYLPCAGFLAHAAALFAAQPVTRVGLSDRWPLALARAGWCWYKVLPGQTILGAADLPLALFDRLAGGERRAVNESRWYAARDQAVEALSAACVAFGRAAAGLPPLEG